MWARARNIRHGSDMFECNYVMGQFLNAFDGSLLL